MAYRQIDCYVRKDRLLGNRVKKNFTSLSCKSALGKNLRHKMALKNVKVYNHTRHYLYIDPADTNIPDRYISRYEVLQLL